MAGNDVSISDIDDAEDCLANLLGQSAGEGQDQISDQEERRPRLVPLPITPTMRRELGLPQKEGFRALYETLIEAHIIPLTEDVPGRVRVTTERRIRSIAARLLLATFAIENTSGPNDRTFENHPAEVREPRPFNLPVRRKGSVSQPPAARGVWPSSASVVITSNSPPFSGDETTSPAQSTPALDVAAPSSPAERSDATAAAATPAPASQANTIHRSLSSLVNFSAQPALPTKLHDALQHWTIGADPALYDWAATQDAPTSQTEAETEDWSEPSGSTRRKVKRRKLSRSMDLDRSSGPPRPSAALHHVTTSASQPVPAVRPTESQASQMVAAGGSQPTTATQESQGQSMSQLVAGRHGNRGAKPKGLKKRKEGF